MDQVDDAAVVLDQAGMTYTVRSAEALGGRSLRSRLRGGASGLRTNTVEALKPLSLVVRRGSRSG